MITCALTDGVSRVRGGQYLPSRDPAIDYSDVCHCLIKSSHVEYSLYRYWQTKDPEAWQKDPRKSPTRSSQSPWIKFTNLGPRSATNPDKNHVP